jgi:rsbT co-antagonist protein RsbR
MVDSATTVDIRNLQQLVDAVTDYALISLDENGVVQGWYGAAQALTGYSPREAVGEQIAILYTAEDVAAGRAATDMRRATETGRQEIQGWLVRRDGARFWASAAMTPVPGPAGRVEGYALVLRDVTGNRAQEVALRGIEQMVNAITDYEVIRLDPDGVVRSWSEGARKLKQYTEKEIVGQHASIFYTQEDARAGVLDRELQAALQAGRVETEGWRVRKDGTQFWCNMVMTTIRDPAGEVTGFVRVGRDLTDQRERDRMLQRQRDEILELSTPVIQVWDKVLVMPIIGTLDSVRASRLTESLLERIVRQQAEVVILDISGVPTIDTDVAQHLLRTVEAARLMGTTSVLSGVRPETAQAIVHLGIDLGPLRSRNSLKEALQLALSLVGAVTSDRAAANE